jgi:hypothetical protein
MSLKKTVTTFFVSLFVLVLPLSSVFADSAGWQTLTYWEKVHWNSTLDYYITNVDGAHASGYVKVCNNSSGGRYFYIKDYDPDNADDHFTYAYLSSGACDSWDLTSMSGIIDGANNQAEIYIQTSNGNSYFSIYD